MGCFSFETLDGHVDGLELLSFASRDSCMGLGGFWHVIQQFRLLSLMDPAVTDRLDLFCLSFVGLLIYLDLSLLNFLPVNSSSLCLRVMRVFLLLSSLMALVNLQILFPSVSRFSCSFYHASIGQRPFCVLLWQISGLCCFELLGCFLYCH